MPRPRRQDFEGAWHHVMNRGIDRASVFRSDDDRVIFLECLAAAARRYALQIHAYCLLDNHFHLLLRSQEGRLSDGMRFLAARFTQRVNYRDDRDGPLFRGRYASVWLSDDAHLARVSRYIHRNPVEAGLVRRPEDWSWSSAGCYLASASKPAWLETGDILALFTMPTQGTYRDFLEADVDQLTRSSYEGWRD